MRKLSTDQEFFWHEEAGARILLPSQLVIQSPFPELYAAVKNGPTAIIVTITSHQATREAAESTIRGPHHGMEPLVVDVLREGAVASPHPGIEVVSENRIIGQPLVTYGWLRVSYLDDPSSTVAVFRVQGDSPFADVESLWQKVMDSFSWDRESAVVLKTGDDINAHSARYAKKKKRRKTPPGPPLPSRVRYLQPFMDDLFSLPSEEVNEDLDTSLLDQLLEQRVKGLSLAKAEARLTADHKALKAWMEENVDHRFAANFVLAIMQAFEFALGERDEA